MTTWTHSLVLIRSRKAITAAHGSHFFRQFKAKASALFAEIAPKTPDIGDSIFSFNYKFAPYYIAWYKAAVALGLTREEADKLLWLINEKLMTAIPRACLGVTGKLYLGAFRKKAAAHEERQRRGALHPYDWRIAYRDIDKNCFEIDITECGFLKLAQDFDARDLLPAICRIDYLVAHLMGNGFERTKTLGDGDDCCNCRYFLVGECEWAPEKGFVNQK